MVFFTCNACNESLKKNQVEKHYTQRCRRCEFLSCVDCGKEFWGDSYQSHTKCISEEQKYSGKDYVAKPNKGEVKQELWIQKVQAAIQKASSNPQLRTLLARLEEFPNVPRKKAKFENFLKCSLRVYNTGLMNQVWDLLMAEREQGIEKTNSEDPKTDSSTKADATAAAVETAVSDGATEPKLSKRERKEERKKKAHKAEKKDKHKADVAEEDGASEKRKKKKGKRRAEEDEEEEENVAEVESQPKKKKRKVENGAAEENGVMTENGENGAETGENGVDDGEDSMLVEEKKGKFSWGATIMAVLQSKGEISVKRLQKKVLAEYSLYDINKPADKLLAKFNKKLSKLPTVKVLKDKAKLIES